MMNFLYLLHVLSVVVWVGGMFFAYMALRPAAASTLDAPQRLTLWSATFSKFFPWVWAAVVLILASGMHMWMKFGGMGAPHYILAMFGLGVVMMLIFAHVFFAPTKKLKRAVAEQNWQAGGAALAQIRMLVGVNLVIGLLVIAVVYLGRVG